MSKLQHKAQPSLFLGSTVEGGYSVTLTDVDFERHKVISGISGAGKSTLIDWIAVSLLRQSIQIIILDPHGSTAKLLLSLLASSDFFRSSQANRLWYVDFKRAETDAAIAFNFLNQPSINTHTIASNFLEAMHRAFPSTGTTANLDNVILAASYILAETNQPVTQLNRLILDSAYRDMLLKKIANPDPLIVQFFKSKFGEKVSSQLVDSSLKRSFLLTYSPVLRNVLGQSDNKLDFRKLIENKMSCIFNLGGLSDYDKRFLGCLLLVSLEQTFLSKTDISSEKKTPVHVIVDEAPLFFAQSETSFTNMLEQCRKAGATIYYAFQTYSQLSKFMAGSLGNALPIIMKASVEDSSGLANRFYRPIEQKQTFDFFGLSRPSPGLFDQVKNIQQARMVFEDLKRQEAIVMRAGKPVKIMTPTLPVNIDQKKLDAIETIYARRLLTPLSHIEKEGTGSHLVVVSTAPSAPVPLAKRRVPRSSSPIVPLQTFVSVAGTDEQLQAMFSLYGYLTVAQVAKLLGKSENTSRTKLKRLVDAGILTASSLPRTTPSGKTPTVFGLKKSARKHEFLEHALATSEIMLTAALLPTVASEFTILDLQSDYRLKTSPIKLADGNILIPDVIVRCCTQDYEYALFCEIDRNTESREKIAGKLSAYTTFASHCECMAVVFVVTEGGDLRVKTLRNWAADVLSDVYRELFLLAPIDLSTLSPETLFLAPLWSSIDDIHLQPLIKR